MVMMQEKECFNNHVTSSLKPEQVTNKVPEQISKWRNIFVLFCLSYNNFWAAACFSLQAPFFPKEAELKGATPTQYGLVFAVFELVIIITSPIYGKMLATISPKFVITAGVFLEGGACILFGILDQIPAGNTYIGMAFAVRIVEGIGAAAFMTASFSIVAAEFPNSVGKTFSLMETAFGFGLIVGPTIGGALYEAGGFALPFAVAGGFQLIGTVLLWCLMPTIGDDHSSKNSKESEIERPHLPQPTNLKEFLLNTGIALYTLAIATSLLFIGFNAATLEPHLRRFDLTPAVLGTIFIITGGVYAFTTPLWGWMVDRGADTFVMMAFGYILTTIGIAFIGPAPFIPFTASVISVVSSLLVIGLGLSAKLVASFSGALKSTLSRGFPDNMATYGMVSALFSSSCSAGAFIGPSLGGLLLDTTGYELGTIVLIAEEAILMLFVTTYIVWKKCRKSSEMSEKTSLLEKGSSKEKVISYSSV